MNHPPPVEPVQEIRGSRGRWLEIVVVGLMVAAVALFVARFVAAERTLYRADQLAYWSYCSNLAEHWRADPVSAARAVAWSVAHSELNLLPAVPISAVMLAIGDSRVAYLLSVVLVFGTATLAALVLSVRETVPGSRPASVAVITAVLTTALLFPTLWRPVLIGYLGLGGVAIGLAILALYLGLELDAMSWRRLALVGFLVAMLALFRRWYVVWCVAFLVVVLLDAGWSVARDSRQWRVALRAPVIIGLVAAATLVLLALPVMSDRFAAGYGEEFAAFTHHGPWRGRLAAVVGEFGLLALAAVAAGAVALLRNSGTRRIGALLSIQMAVSYLLMVRIQDHSPHHWYLYLPAMLLLVSVPMTRLVAAASRSRRVLVAACAAAMVSGSVTAAVLWPSAGSFADVLGPVLPGHRMRPAVRSDLARIRRLLATLDRLMTRRPGAIYVLGCSGTLSEQTLAFANQSLGTRFRSCRMILSSAHVDRRDGFPRALLEADYVVVPQPYQINMRPEDQQVVVIPTRSFLSGTTIAPAFRRLPDTFHLEGGVRVWIFQRQRPNRPDEVEQLSRLLRQAHPDRPEVYRAPAG